MATTSRYSTAADADKPTSTASTSGASGTESVTTDSTTTKSGTSTSNQQNMTGQSLAALEALIQQLLGGGTPSMRQDKKTKNNEIVNLQQDRDGYSKEAAFADAQGLMAQTMRQALEKLIPSINQGAMGAGASQSSMRALLTQRAAENAAEAAAAQGLGAAVQYGGVANGMSAVIERLLAQQDPAAQALIQALGVAKGAVSNTVNNYNETSNTSGTTTGTKSTTGFENKNVSYDGAAPTFSNVPASSGLQFFGPLETDQSIALNNLKYTGTTQDTLSQLYGQNTWSGYTF
jgi:hypothetical protein